MPEVVEVTLIVESLRRIFLNKCWEKIEIPKCSNCQTGGSIFAKPPQGIENFSQDLPLKVTKISNKGKFLWIQLQKENENIDTKSWFIGITFGLAGTFNPNPSRHSHIHIQYLYQKEPEQYGNIYWDDYKSMGKWIFWDNEKQFQEELDKLGIDVLSHALSLGKEGLTSSISIPLPIPHIISLFRKHNGKNIGRLLLDQKFIAGIGNYIKNEVLYGAKISPYSKVKDLSDNDLKNLWNYILNFIQKIYHTRKETLGNNFFVYEGILNEIKKDNSFCDSLHIYNKERDSENNLIEKISAKNSPDGRIVYWVPSLQNQ